MSEVVLKKQSLLNNAYFETRSEQLERRLTSEGFSPERVAEIKGIVRGLSDEELGAREAVEKARKAGITGDGRFVFSSLVQTRRELNQAIRDGHLSPEDAQKWKESFGLSKAKDQQPA